MPNYWLLLFTLPLLALFAKIGYLIGQITGGNDGGNSPVTPTIAPTLAPSLSTLCSQGDEFCCDASDVNCRYRGRVAPQSNCFVLTADAPGTAVNVQRTVDLSLDDFIPLSFNVALPYMRAAYLTIGARADPIFPIPGVDQVDVVFPIPASTIGEFATGLPFPAGISFEGDVVTVSLFGMDLFSFDAQGVGTFLTPLELSIGVILEDADEQDLCLWETT